MRRSIAHRGNCLVATLFGLAFIGLVLLVGGLVGALTSSPADAAAKLSESIHSMQPNRFEAPGSIEIDLDAGGIIVALAPDGTVGDRRIGAPPAGTRFETTLRDSAGIPLAIQDTDVPTDPNAPFSILATAEIFQKGTYTLDVRSTGDGSVPAAIVVTSGNTAALTMMGESVGTFLKLFGSVCLAAVGLALVLFCGIPGLIVAARQRKLRRPDPLAEL